LILILFAFYLLKKRKKCLQNAVAVLGHHYTYVPVKLKLQHPPRVYPRQLTVILARGGGNLNVALKGWGI